MRKLLHAAWPDSHCFASVKNAVENNPSASAKSKNKCFLYNRNLPVLTFAKLLLSRIAWASPWAPPWLVLMPTNCHNNFFEWSDLQKLGTRNQIDILYISDFLKVSVLILKMANYYFQSCSLWCFFEVSHRNSQQLSTQLLLLYSH